ncbi:MAG: phosphomethylpyrimidine synthase [Methanobrevibacter sp.]|nr:phosphomethylpyrimidine synthase [Candidatus Methanovirga australis]
MTLIEDAKKGTLDKEYEKIATMENMDFNKFTKNIAKGKIIVPKNVNRNTKLCPIGNGLSTKVNANIGSSSRMEDLEIEIQKAEIAIKYGADALMDLSTGSNLKEFRKRIMGVVDVPIGTVPIYEAVVTAKSRDGSIMDMSEDDIFNAITNQIKEGVDFMTLHCGINRDLINKLKSSQRLMGIVSRGGTFLASWMVHNNEENPLFKNYDYLLELAYEYDVTLSLGDGLRPGCIKDATDIPQIQELITLGTLVKEAQNNNVQVMVEGPGHVPLNQIASNMQIQKTICNSAPFYVLGPIVTDLAMGYDHITSAIGGALAAYSGADFLCYVTPAEHLSLPSLEDVKDGVIASKIAAQSADTALGLSSAWEKEMSMDLARKNFDWDKQFELTFDSDKAKKYREKISVEEEDMCSMCGEYCALRIGKDL